MLEAAGIMAKQHGPACQKVIRCQRPTQACTNGLSVPAHHIKAVIPMQLARSMLHAELWPAAAAGAPVLHSTPSIPSIHRFPVDQVRGGL